MIALSRNSQDVSARRQRGVLVCTDRRWLQLSVLADAPSAKPACSACCRRKVGSTQPAVTLQMSACRRPRSATATRSAAQTSAKASVRVLTAISQNVGRGLAECAAQVSNIDGSHRGRHVPPRLLETISPPKCPKRVARIREARRSVTHTRAALRSSKWRLARRSLPGPRRAVGSGAARCCVPRDICASPSSRVRGRREGRRLGNNPPHRPKTR